MTMGRRTAHFPSNPMRCFRPCQGSIIVVAQAPGGIRHSATAVTAGYGLSTVATTPLAGRLTAGGEMVRQASTTLSMGINIALGKESKTGTPCGHDMLRDTCWRAISRPWPVWQLAFRAMSTDSGFCSGYPLSKPIVPFQAWSIPSFRGSFQLEHSVVQSLASVETASVPGHNRRTCRQQKLLVTVPSHVMTMLA